MHHKMIWGIFSCFQFEFVVWFGSMENISVNIFVHKAIFFLKIFGLILRIGVIVLYSETGDISLALVTYYHSAHRRLYGSIVTSKFHFIIKKENNTII